MAATKKIAPYGEWESPISVEAATAGSRSLSSPRVCPRSGRAFFLQSKANGSNTIVEIRPDGSLARVLPEPWGASNTVYEYGGLPYAVVPAAADGSSPLTVIFSDARDNSVSLLDVDAGTVRPLVKDTPALRYGDFHPHPAYHPAARPWVLAVQEDHPQGAPAAEVQNYVVALDTRSGAVHRVVVGADFYAYPRFSPDGALVAWRQWDHPGLPFDGPVDRWGRWVVEEDGGSSSEVPSIADAELVVPGADVGFFGEMHWCPDGSLVFTQERDGEGFRQLFRRRPGGTVEPLGLKGLEEAEFGDASWAFGCQTFVFPSPTTMVAVYTKFGESRLIYADLAQPGHWVPLDLGLVDMRLDPLAALSPSSFLVIGSGYTTPQAVYRVELDTQKNASKPVASVTTVCTSTDTSFDPAVFSTPELITVTAATTEPKGRTIYGWYWPPHSTAFAAPAGELPPLIVIPHGGPTGYTSPGLSMTTQFWATRGYAVFAINYSGSAGHGRAYRDALWMRWGLLDRDDVPECVAALAASGRADRARVGIVGGSAGGYNVLQSLVWHPAVFASGVCCCGVSDTAALDRETHKLESKYVPRLFWPAGDPAVTDEVKAAIHRERSPIYHAERIAAPLLLIHGDRDTVVPVAQSGEIKRKVAARGGMVEMVVLPGEGHMFKKTESMRLFFESQEDWWRRTLLKKGQ